MTTIPTVASHGLVKQLSVALISCVAFAAAVRAQGTYTAASCNESAVATAVSSELATPVSGDIVSVPSGSCTWTTGLNVTWTTSVTLQFQGSIITDNVSGTTPLINFTVPAGSTFRMTGGTLQPVSSTVPSSGGVPIDGNGGSGLPTALVRVDHMTLTGWYYANTATSFLIYASNLFGVFDHNTISFDGNEVFDIFMPNYLNVGSYGDNSWGTADTWGSANALYIENNTFTNLGTNTAAITDCDYYGCRFVARFNTITMGAFENHGTESGGRGRGGRTMEVYDNTFNTTTGNYAAYAAQLRSGTAMVFGNTLNQVAGTGYNEVAALSLNRAPNSLGGWGNCDGSGPWDQNDGHTVVNTGHTVSSVSGSTLTANGSPGWTANEFEPGSTTCASGGGLCNLADTATFGVGSCSILGNSTTTLTLGGGCSGIVNGDSFEILGTTLYVQGTFNGTSGSTTLTDTSKSWTTSQWVSSGSPYSVRDLTQGFGADITANTSDTATLLASNGYGQNNEFTSGDQYAILRATICIDQDSRGEGNLLSGAVPALGFPSDALDPVYEWDDTLQGSPSFGIVVPITARYLANRDYYSATYGQTAQTSSTSPFNGTSGTGWGTLANRPTTCTPSVGHWATDQGSWNSSGSGGQGELFVCTATNTWSLYYTPYTYPHPLTQVLNPPTGLQATAH